MRFLAPFLGFLAGEAAMVIHLVARIKMGKGNEWPGLFGPVDLAAPHADVHRVGFGIVGYVGHGFRLAFGAYTAPSFRGAKRTRNFEIPRCAIAHLRSGPSDHPGMTSGSLSYPPSAQQ
jgi:hypothetical protein